MRRLRLILGLTLGIAAVIGVTAAAVHVSQRAEAGIAVTNIELLIDCNSSTAAIDSNCVYPDGTTAVEVAVVLKNNGPDTSVGAFVFYLKSDNRGVFTPNTVACPNPQHDCNPDFNQADAGNAADWACGPPGPNPDYAADTDPSTSYSFLSCFNGQPSGPDLLQGDELVLGTVDFNVTTDVYATLELKESSVLTRFFEDLGYCEPATGVEMNCVGASIQVGSDPATPTPTITPTSLPTATSTPGPPPTPSGTPTGAVSTVLALNVNTCLIASAALVHPRVDSTTAALGCFSLSQQSSLQTLVACWNRLPFPCGLEPPEVFRRTEPDDFRAVDLDADQASPLMRVLIIAFVEGDSPVTFEAAEGSWGVFGFEVPGSLECYSAAPFLGLLADPDCDGDPATQGDGVVVGALVLPEGVAREPLDVTVTQNAISRTHTINVVGPPVEILVESLDGKVQLETGALPATPQENHVPYAFLYEPFSADRCEPPLLAPMGSASPKITNLMVRALDSDGVELTGALINWRSTAPEPTFSVIGRSDQLPEGGTGYAQAATWDMGPFGIGGVQSVCGGYQPGPLNMSLSFDPVLTVGAPSGYALPYSIDVTGSSIDPVTERPLDCPLHIDDFSDCDADGFPNDSDNCFTLPSSNQLNSDRNFIDNSPPYRDTTDDSTRLRSDPDGDVCDIDDDNDGLWDIDEQQGTQCPASTGPTSPTAVDSDGDSFSDGGECSAHSDPADAADAPDWERCGKTTDTDGDRVSDREEFCRLGGHPYHFDTDGDYSPDICEIASLNSDLYVNSLDQGMLAAAIAGRVPYHANIDINKDGVTNSMDQGLQVTVVLPWSTPSGGSQYVCVPLAPD